MNERTKARTSAGRSASKETAGMMANDKHHADDPFRGPPMIDAVPELAPLSGRGQVREPEVDPLLHHPSKRVVSRVANNDSSSAGRRSVSTGRPDAPG